MNLQDCKSVCIARVICPTLLLPEVENGILKGFRAEDVLIRARKIIPSRDGS